VHASEENVCARNPEFAALPAFVRYLFVRRQQIIKKKEQQKKTRKIKTAKMKTK
jgi:hypothetical protein